MGICACCCGPKEERLNLLEPEEKVEEMDIQDMEPYRNSRLVSVRTEFSRFRQLKVLGKGGFGKVLLVEDEITGHLHAMKVINKQHIEQRNQRLHTKAERTILEGISHPFVVGLQYAFQSPARLFLVMEFMQGGELFFHLRKEHRFSEEKTQMYAAQILLALEYLHDKNVIYRDLKPENILVGEDGYLRITDFGLSKVIV
jgi:serine/threonine protein kinase